MKIQHAYCCPQHKTAVDPVLIEMEERGHEIVEVRLHHNDVTKRMVGYEEKDISNSDIFLCSYPRIMKMGEGGSWNHGARKSVCIEHGLNPIAWAFPLDRHKLFDAICCSNKWQIDKSGNDLKGKCVLTGWSKLDRLYRLKKEVHRDYLVDRLNRSLNEPIDPSKPIIAWCPTHSGAWNKTDALRSLGIKNFVIAPHEGRYRAFHDDMSIDYSKEYPHYLETTDIYEVLSVADLLITDYSSVGMEALAIENLPVIQILENRVLHNRKDFSVLGEGYYALSQNDKREFKLGANIANTNDVVPEIEKALADPIGYWKKERDYWRNEFIHDFGNATKNVCDFLESL